MQYIQATFWFLEKNRGMRAMLGLHLLIACMTLHAYFKETTGTGPTRQLV